MNSNVPEVSLTDIVTQLSIFKILAISLPNFYRRTNISAQMTINYNPKEQGLEINFGFLPQEPTKDQYNILFEEILDAEKLLYNEHIINISGNFENIKQLIFKCKEETQNIVERHKNIL